MTTANNSSRITIWVVVLAAIIAIAFFTLHHKQASIIQPTSNQSQILSQNQPGAQSTEINEAQALKAPNSESSDHSQVPTSPQLITQPQ